MYCLIIANLMLAMKIKFQFIEGGNRMTVEERMDFLEYRQDLLFENTPYSRTLFEYGVTREQEDAIGDIFEEYRGKIEANESVNNGSFEQRIYQAVPHLNGNYHFVEFLTKENFARGAWTEVFEVLYGESPKFQTYLQNNRS